MLSAQKISTGKLILRIDFPDSKFLPILERINFKTPFWSSIFFWSTKMIPPILSSWIHSPFHIGCPLIAYWNTNYFFGKGFTSYLFLINFLLMMTLPALSNSFLIPFTVINLSFSVFSAYLMSISPFNSSIWEYLLINDNYLSSNLPSTSWNYIYSYSFFLFSFEFYFEGLVWLVF